MTIGLMLLTPCVQAQGESSFSTSRGTLGFATDFVLASGEVVEEFFNEITRHEPATLCLIGHRLSEVQDSCARASLRRSSRLTVEIVHDYLSIGFQGDGHLNILNDYTVDGSDKDHLSIIRGCRVELANYSKSVFRLASDNSVAINVGISSKDFHGPEAMVYVGPDGEEVIWRGWEEDTQFN
jgi:hypothetical protein